MLASCCALVLALAQDTEMLREERADGVVVEREVAVGPDGAVVGEGSYREWWPDGTPKVEGRFREGARHGKWRAWYPDGSVAAAGWYEHGLRERQWTVRSPDGSLVEEDSGVFEAVELRTRDGPRARGETRADLRHGRFSFFWPGGATQLVCRYRDGELHGPLLFVHADGTPDPDWISGMYVAGRRQRPLPPGEPERLAEELVPPRSSHGRGEAAGLVEVMRTEALLPESERRAEGRLFELALDDERLPEVLWALDLGRADEARLATLIVRERVLPLYGSAFAWTEDPRPSGLEGFALSERSRRRWASLLAIADEGFLRLDMTLARAGRPEDTVRLWLDDLHPLPADVRGVVEPPALAPRFKPRKGKRSEAVERAIDWLLRHQELDGSWDDDRFTGRCRGEPCTGEGLSEFDDATAMTGLALLVLMANGHAPGRGEHGGAVARGLGWLVLRQHPSGALGNDLYNHAIGTLALAEGAALTDHARLRVALGEAVDLIERARNPYSAWRYDLPPVGANDTSVTTWMVSALHAAGLAGVEFDPEARTGALSWYDEVTDPSTGRCGYESIGTGSSRIERINDHFPPERGEAMTAAALHGRYLLGQRPDEVDIMGKYAALLGQRPPAWDPDGFACDFYYWYHAAQALHQLGGSGWRTWSKALDEALIDSQREEGDEAGSWDPVGPWCFRAGRIYATALGALALSAEWRMTRLAELD